MTNIADSGEKSSNDNFHYTADSGFNGDECAIDNNSSEMADTAYRDRIDIEGCCDCAILRTKMQKLEHKITQLEPNIASKERENLDLHRHIHEIKRKPFESEEQWAAEKRALFCELNEMRKKGDVVSNEGGNNCYS